MHGVGQHSRFMHSGLTRLLWCCLAACLLNACPTPAQTGSSQDALSHAVELHESGHFAEAIIAYEAYLKAHPQASAVRSNLGAALAHEGRYPEAVREYTEALKAEPTNFGIRFNLGLAHYKMGDMAQAVKEFEAVYAVQSADDRNRRRLVLLLSECYLRQGQDDRVVALLDPLSDTDVHDLTLAYLLGTALLHQGKDERGALMIQRILKNGDTAEAHMLMGYTRLKANDKNGAVEEVERALALNPNLPEAYSLRGRLAYLTADMDGAERAFRKALTLDPTAYEPLLWLGTLLREEGKETEARAFLERATQSRPQDLRVRYQFALLYADDGDDQRAAAILESLIKDEPDFTEAHRSLSTIYFRLGRAAAGRQEKKIAEALEAAVQSKDLARGKSLQK